MKKQIIGKIWVIIKIICVGCIIAAGLLIFIKGSPELIAFIAGMAISISVFKEELKKLFPY